MTGGSVRQPVDVLLVSLGSTFGLRAADDQLADLLAGCGLSVHVARAAPAPEVRTLALTDLVQARACAAAARAALREVDPTAVIYGSTTAALLWPRPGAIRFDALAQRTRPGHHGPWQRPLERRRLGQAPLLLPWARASLDGAPADAADRAVVLPVALDPQPVDPSTDAAVGALLAPIGAAGERAVAITYAADAAKKGLDRTVGAWAQVRGPGETLLVAGRDALPPQFAGAPGVRCVGRLPREAFRALVRAVGLLVMAPRREDYGLVQLEALAEGARVVTTAAPGPYAALPVLREHWPSRVVERPDDLAALGRAIRAALDAPPDPAEQLQLTRAAAPWARSAVLAQLREQVVPKLLG